ncbi:hypothetical protein [Burkholderia multivorans]|uniref:hypothetical protein n=1 Tax=Burkholderia multivorans TaxID=87883 RepID=UPI0028636941|nr:hypothetical protein [Burkholderia multivorans]MDR8920514.1 hypothetical protein [Burkholderia multivorans]MDR8921919.1 hypothetical protein [Burkholderia multivorans]MDR8965950.1 hypothetical protein [Burkholderia multivorans]MDR8988576.1 hypothetical protein [Burkholderia multivorans]MDR9019575.1 hypothetical protein [Burkholderia multivorans]
MTTDTNTTAPRFTVTLDALRKAGACYDGYNKLVRSIQGETFSAEDAARNSHIHFKHDAEIPLVDVLNSNGIDDAHWSLRCVSGADRDIRLFAVWCARQVEHLMQDQRSKDALDVAERFANGEATEEERVAAEAAAWDAQAEMFKRMCLGTAPWQQGKVAA